VRSSTGPRFNVRMRAASGLVIVWCRLSDLNGCPTAYPGMRACVDRATDPHSGTCGSKTEGDNGERDPEPNRASATGSASLGQRSKTKRMPLSAPCDVERNPGQRGLC